MKCPSGSPTWEDMNCITARLENHSLTLDVKNYPPGMYIIHFVAGNETETGYFIKQ